MKEVRDGEDSLDSSETEEELENEKTTNLESPPTLEEEIGGMEEFEVLPDFLHLGVRV